MTTPPEEDDPRYTGYWSAWMDRAHRRVVAGICAVCLHPAPHANTCGCRSCYEFWSIQVPDFVRACLQETTANQLGEQRAKARRRNWRGAVGGFASAAVAGVVGAVVTWPVLLWLAGAPR